MKLIAVVCFYGDSIIVKKKVPSKELNRICMLESCNFVFMKSLNHRMVLVKKLVDSIQCIKVYTFY